MKCKLGGEARGTGTHAGAWSLYCHCVAPRAEIQLGKSILTVFVLRLFVAIYSVSCVDLSIEPTVWMNNQGVLECHGHVGKPIGL